MDPPCPDLEAGTWFGLEETAKHSQVGIGGGAVGPFVTWVLGSQGKVIFLQALMSQDLFTVMDLGLVQTSLGLVVSIDGHWHQFSAHRNPQSGVW